VSESSSVPKIEVAKLPKSDQAQRVSALCFDRGILIRVNSIGGTTVHYGAAWEIFEIVGQKLCFDRINQNSRSQICPGDCPDLKKSPMILTWMKTTVLLFDQKHSFCENYDVIDTEAPSMHSELALPDCFVHHQNLFAQVE
jgi:hypothetical protein